MEVQLLLTEVSTIFRKYDQLNRKTGGYFNIFEITNIASNEVAICRVLHDLLNPKGSHYQGDCYLALFVKNVLQIDDFNCKAAVVSREYAIDQNRRIDLVIKDETHLIPIEVKLYATDQKNQCADYYKAAKNSNVYYLTLFGTPPSDYSANGLTAMGDGDYREVTTLSFRDDILNWLYACVGHRSTLTLAPIREMIIQLIAVMRRLTGQLEEGTAVEMKEVLMRSSDNMRSAFAIETHLKECKVAMLERVFSSLEGRLSAHGMEKTDIYDYTSGKAAKFYDHIGSTYPGISYMYRENVKPNTDILFRIEIEESLYCGFCVAYNRESGKQRLTDSELKTFLPHIEPIADNWWAYWELLPVDDANNAPTFKYPDADDVYFKLYEKEYFEQFIDDCVNRILLLCGKV